MCPYSHFPKLPVGQNGVFVFGRADFGPWALCFDTPNRENAIEKPQTKFDTENFQYHSKSSFAGKNWFMRVENSHAIIIQEPQVNCVICKLETAEVLFYMHDIKKLKTKKKSGSSQITGTMFIIMHIIHHLISPVLFLFLFLPQPHTLLSLVSVHLAQGNVTGALALFRHILVTALSSSSFTSFSGCEQCRNSLPLLRCLQFYPSLYNLSNRQSCSSE